MKTKTKPNRYKPVPKLSASNYLPGSSIDFCLKWIMLVAGISLFSLALIFAYDLVTQSAVFNIKQVSITGIQRIDREEILSFAGLDKPRNFFKLNVHKLEQKLCDHPWVEQAFVRRGLTSDLKILVVEHQALAIVKIENISDIIINEKGRPFKEYDPAQDHLETLPVITGLDLTRSQSQYIFDGILFNAVMNYLNLVQIKPELKIHADEQMGLTIETTDRYNTRAPENRTIRIKMGFENFPQKLKKAENISQYIDTHFPDTIITAMDLFDLKKIFIKTELNDPERTTTEKGV